MKKKSLRPRKRVIRTTISWKGYCSECKFWELKETLMQIENKIYVLFSVGGYEILHDSPYDIPKVERKDCICNKFKIVRSIEATPCMFYSYADRGKIDLLPKLLISRSKQGECIYEEDKLI